MTNTVTIDSFGQALSDWVERQEFPRIRTLSLFSGAGGLDIGFHDAGFRVAEMVEIDERFCKTLAANTEADSYFGPARVRQIDIREYDPSHLGQIDFIIGGPPCQTFSAAGRRAAGVAGTSDRRGTLFEEYVRLLAKLQPQGFLFENVYGITGAENGEAWRQICEGFRGAGYTISHRVLDAADFGVPQHRERMLIVGMKSGQFLFPAPTHGPDSYNGPPHVSARQALSGCHVSASDRRATVGGRFGPLLCEIPPGLNYSFFTENMGHPNPIFAWRSKFSDFLYKADPQRPIRTLKAQGGQYTGPFHWDSRPFGVSELKRLQTIPDSFRIVGGRQVAVHQIGNSVPPQLARILAIACLQQVFGVTLPASIPTLRPDQVLGFRTRKRHLTSLYRATAHEAIATSGTKMMPVRASRRAYVGELTRDFDWIVRGRGETGLMIRFVPTQKQWKIYVGKNSAESPAFSILVQADRRSWPLETEKIYIDGERRSPQLFTAGWKALESELVRSGGKADLVQLAGYYQYRPAIKAEMVFPHRARPSMQWLVLQKIVSGVGTRAMHSVAELAGLWRIDPSEVSGYAHWLRSLGYEVRNSNTNTKIPPGVFLVPYSFPTLTPASVQLRKSLEATDG